MPTTTDFSWMKRLCNPKVKEDEITHHPMRVVIGETPYAVATDGAMLVAVRADSDLEPAGRHAATIEENFREYLEGEPKGKPIDLASLKEWCGGPNWPGDKDCPECKGKGRATCDVCDGVGYVTHTCDYCDHEHEGRCLDCDGSGEMECDRCGGSGKDGYVPPTRPGWLGDMLVNRELLARALDRFSDRTVHVDESIDRRAYPTVVVYGPDWRVILMGMRPSLFDPKERKGWPQLALGQCNRK